MFVIIKFGEGESILFNPDCRMRIFNIWIRSKVGIPVDAVVDLCDMNGALKRLDNKDDNAFVSSYLDHRSTYVPVTIHRKETTGRVDKIIPYLHSADEAYAKVAGKLNDEVRSAGRTRSKERLRRVVRKGQATLAGLHVTRSGLQTGRGRKKGTAPPPATAT